MMPASSWFKVLDPIQSYLKTFFQKKRKKGKLQEAQEKIRVRDKIKKEKKQKLLQYGVSNQYYELRNVWDN